jgi:hypothetical protein
VGIGLVAPANDSLDAAHVAHLVLANGARDEHLVASPIGQAADQAGGLGSGKSLWLDPIPADGDRLVVIDANVDRDQHTGVPAQQLTHPPMGERVRRQDRHAVDAAVPEPTPAARGDTPAGYASRAPLRCQVHKVGHRGPA